METNQIGEAPVEVNRLAHADGETPGTLAMNAVRFRIAGDQVLKGTAGYSERPRDLIRWAAGYCRDRNLSPADFGQLIANKYGEAYSGDSVWKLLTGRREESEIGPIVDSIEKLRRSVEESLGRTVTGFVETKLTKAMWRLLDRARKWRRLTLIFGESQIGKTAGITEYARRHNHGLTTLVRMPTRGAIGNFMEELARSLGIPTQQKHGELRRRLIEAFDESMLLIVDEAHQCMLSTYAARSLATLEFIREIHDRRKCGVVLVGTNVLREGITTGPDSRMLRQLWLRAYAPLQLPDRPSEANLAEFARSFGLEPAEAKLLKVRMNGDDGEQQTIEGNPLAVQAAVIKDWGLGRWLSILQEAAEDAKEAGTKLSWGRVLKTHQSYQKMQTPEA